jgi:predicted DsbA family dithiol-disulfide isomerase
MKTVPILYFSDILCVWAHIAQLRVDELRRTFGDQVRFDRRFCNVFGDTASKMATTWAAKGGYEGFNTHLRHAAAQFPEVTLNPDIWLTVRPASSMPAHVFLKAVQLCQQPAQAGDDDLDRATRGLRKAFFEEARDISRRDTHCDVGEALGLDVGRIEARIHDGAAFAALADDLQQASALGIQGSPSFLLNDGRQKLYGNLGFRVIEANIREILRAPSPDDASWC